MAAIETQKEKKGRFSRLLGSKRDKSPESPPTFPPDSAYASETPITDKSTTDIVPAEKNNNMANMVPAEKNSDIANIDKNRNLAVNPSTGEVLDRDTGEVVTVVTTTTTTTTTTTRKPGKKPDVQKDVRETTQTQPALNGTNTNDPIADHPAIAEMPTEPGTPGEKPPLPGRVKTIPDPVPESVPDSASSNRLRKQSPGIPPRSNRRSGDRNSFNPSISDTTPDTGYFAQAGPTGNTPPLSPTRASNFSYPYRNRDSFDQDGVSLATTDHPQHHSKSTMGDLRAAAKGIHGVGETLRGTFNNTIDQNFPRKNERKAATANAKNEAVLARGRTEVSGIPHPGGSHQVHPSQQQYPGGYTHHPQQHPPAPPSGVNVPPSSAALPVKPPSPQRTPTNDQTVPGSWSPEYDGAADGPATSATGGLAPGGKDREREKSRSISKLFKRKPVAAKEGELRVTNP